MTIFKSSQITWGVMSGDAACDDWITSYCADGDGMVQVVVYADRIELQDQMEVCKAWGFDSDIRVILESAQSYIAATYHQIYEDAMHWEDTPTIDELREEMNSINGYGHLNLKG
jgi:hypothetical protein